MLAKAPTAVREEAESGTDMSKPSAEEVPQTLEGWYVLHDVYSIDWPAWKALEESDRHDIGAEAESWLSAQAACEKGDSAAYSVVTQKGDLMFVHYRQSPEDLNTVELAQKHIGLHDYLRPAYSYLSVIEVSLHEAQAIAAKRIADAGIEQGSPDYADAFAKELEKQKERMNERLFRDVPPHGYICFYPMSKRRGETVNWYAISQDERRMYMRRHGSIGHKYHKEVTQIIGGSVGLDDWEWGVSLHADDPLVFKKLIYEMRFDPASALFAEFGPFYIGIRKSPDQLGSLLRP